MDFTTFSINCPEASRKDAEPLNTGVTLTELMRRPELDYDKLAPIDHERSELPEEVREQVNILIKYDGYISRQIKQVESFKKLEKKKIPIIMRFRVCALRRGRS